MLLAIAGVAAVADWVAVWKRPASIETVLKPLVLVALIGVALTIDPADGGQRAWFVAALVLSLAGDVFLLPSVDKFVPGLASFLLAHVAYVVGFLQVDRPSGWQAIFVVLLVPVVLQVVRGVRRKEPSLLVPVCVYIAVIAAMLGTALATGQDVARQGATLFAVSDSILALDRFDQHRRWMPTSVMVTYHVAQGLLVLSLLP